tara:strand:- start:18404 stop:18832 length:429 start_codon:yes stop_codon:yes gene_type:complete
MDSLTAKQSIVYKMMLTTKTYENMEVIMNLSKGGIRFYVSQIMSKMDYSNRIELMSDYYAQNHKFNIKKHNCGLTLNDLETNIFNCIIKGFTLSETALIVGIKINMVRCKRTRIMKLAKVGNALQLVCKYYNIGNEFKGGAE